MIALLTIPVITNFGEYKAWSIVFRIFDVCIGELSTKEIQRLAKKFPEIEEHIQFMLENYQSSKNKKPDDNVRKLTLFVFVRLIGK